MSQLELHGKVVINGGQCFLVFCSDTDKCIAALACKDLCCISALSIVSLDDRANILIQHFLGIVIQIIVEATVGRRDGDHDITNALAGNLADKHFTTQILCNRKNGELHGCFRL